MATKIVFKESFALRLERQIRFIATNNPQNARRFKNSLLTRIKEIAQNPYACRKSIYFDDIEIRDLIYKGYTIIYLITDINIEVFGFLKHQKDPTDQ
jgi:plasmid stabilization system protein ParE